MLFSKKKYLVKAMLRKGNSTHYINVIIEARTKRGASKIARNHFSNKYQYEIKAGYHLIMNKEPQRMRGAK